MITLKRVLIGAAAAVALAAAWYLGSPLLISRQVDEALPQLETVTSQPGAPSELQSEPADSQAPVSTAIPFDPGSFNQLARGSFMDADDFHLGSGTALLLQQGDGTVFLRLESFNVTNGPDLHVYLAEGNQPQDRGSLGEYLDLGELKGNVGNQNYDIPPSTDLSAFNSVVIYCEPFHVVFSTATISWE
jgi:hypothetical protein